MVYVISDVYGLLDVNVYEVLEWLRKRYLFSQVITTIIPPKGYRLSGYTVRQKKVGKQVLKRRRGGK